MTDNEFLTWLVQRMVVVYNETESVDFISRLKRIAARLATENPEAATVAIGGGDSHAGSHPHQSFKAAFKEALTEQTEVEKVAFQRGAQHTKERAMEMVRFVLEEVYGSDEHKILANEICTQLSTLGVSEVKQDLSKLYEIGQQFRDRCCTVGACGLCQEWDAEKRKYLTSRS